MGKNKAIKPINLVQPNKVTNARYDYTEREENILTLIIDAVQKHMTREKPMEVDLFGEPTVTMDIGEVDAINKTKYWQAAKNMKFKTFEFEYTNLDKRIEDVSGVLVTTVRNIRGTSLIKITINKWAIPYLLYWGKGVGGTIFGKMIALKLRGQYAKRLYKLCKRWEDQGGFSMSIDELRKMLALENKYPLNANLKARILEPARKEMKNRADVYFDYEFDKVGGSRSYNYIHFKITGNDKSRPDIKKTDRYLFVYGMIGIAYPHIKNNKARLICDQLAQDPDQLRRLYNRLQKLKQELDEVTKKREDAAKLIKFILKNDYSIE